MSDTAKEVTVIALIRLEYTHEGEHIVSKVRGFDYAWHAANKLYRPGVPITITFDKWVRKTND